MSVRLWVALDVPQQMAADELLEALWPHRDIKIGMELFYRLGPGYVAALAARGYRIFLDLKCHDIPRTVARAVQAVSDLGVEMVTVHAAGGLDMLNQARQAAGETQIVAVTALTSLDDETLRQVGIHATVNEFVQDSARVAQQAGVAGLVCAASEVETLRRQWPGARLVVPGIRLPGDEMGDQRRVSTPGEAQQLGATDLVVGRAIVQSHEPKAALDRFMADLVHN